MARNPRDRIAGLLSGGLTAGFSAELSAPAEALHLQVAGIGPVGLPIHGHMAKRLIAAARPAQFGLGEQTLTDATVRSTWELTPDQVRLGGPGWTALVDRTLEHARDELRLPLTARLGVALNSMLVYGKGQFFLPHQDSEKDDTMIGTVVVSLPSAHTGGDLVIEHAGKRTVHHASRDELGIVAFYADCRHEVRPVRSGHRVSLTFNLLAQCDADAAPPEAHAELTRYLTAHFTEPVASPYGDDLGAPKRLVVLLDHEYTQRGLDWRRLKGADAERAALLRAAADAAGCTAALALADVQETWGAWPAGGGYDHDGWRREDTWSVGDGEVAVDVDAADYDLRSLQRTEVSLEWWPLPDGNGLPAGLRIPAHEICGEPAGAGLPSYRCDYEGYMGNYGNTLDRWYRRAVVVVWPREQEYSRDMSTSRAKRSRHLYSI